MGTVHCYITHYYNNEKHYLAVVDPMLSQTLEASGVPVVTRRAPEERRPKTAVISIHDIVTVVGLVRYLFIPPNKFKVVWPYNRYDEKLDGKRAGRLSQL